MPLILRTVSVRPKSSARDIIRALHEAKQELAQELDANLKQLKSVLEESQRIAKELEAVLKEVRCDPEPEEKALGRQEEARAAKGAGNRAAGGDAAQRDRAAENEGEPARESSGGQEQKPKQGNGWNPPPLRKPARLGPKAESVPGTWLAPTRRSAGEKQAGPWQPPPEAQDGQEQSKQQ